MTDVHTKEVRSFNMSRIRGKDTKPELIVRRFLHAKGFRYRLHSKELPGKPDLVLPKYRTVIFIHGCFWHGHDNCKYYVIPKSNTEWWKSKILNNQKVDLLSTNKLHTLGWKVIIIWECELKPQVMMETLAKLPGKIIS